MNWLNLKCFHCISVHEMLAGYISQTCQVQTWNVWRTHEAAGQSSFPPAEAIISQWISYWTKQALWGLFSETVGWPLSQMKACVCAWCVLIYSTVCESKPNCLLDSMSFFFFVFALYLQICESCWRSCTFCKGKIEPRSDTPQSCFSNVRDKCLWMNLLCSTDVL